MVPRPSRAMDRETRDLTPYVVAAWGSLLLLVAAHGMLASQALSEGRMTPPMGAATNETVTVVVGALVQPGDELRVNPVPAPFPPIFSHAEFWIAEGGNRSAWLEGGTQGPFYTGSEQAGVPVPLAEPGQAFDCQRPTAADSPTVVVAVPPEPSGETHGEARRSLLLVWRFHVPEGASVDQGWQGGEDPGAQLAHDLEHAVFFDACHAEITLVPSWFKGMRSALPVAEGVVGLAALLATGALARRRLGSHEAPLDRDPPSAMVQLLREGEGFLHRTRWLLAASGLLLLAAAGLLLLLHLNRFAPPITLAGGAPWVGTLATAVLLAACVGLAVVWWTAVVRVHRALGTMREAIGSWELEE